MQKGPSPECFPSLLPNKERPHYTGRGAQMSPPLPSAAFVCSAHVTCLPGSVGGRGACPLAHQARAS